MPKAVPFVGLLDLYPNAAVAYSLRKLRTAYTGDCIRVRRSNDNAEQDIAFVGNDLDTTTMLDFVGYNLWTYSEEWDNAAYTKSQLNITGTPSYINVETAPDSTLTGDKIIENTASATHSTARTFLVTNGVTYNVSVYLKGGGRDARVTSAISTVATYQVDVDLTNGTLSGSTFPTSPVLDSVGSGWYRLSYSVTAANTATRTAMSILLLNGASTNYLGDGTSGVFIWGSQISQSSTVKTYQKTVATAGGNGFISTWYDQSTNANNSTQETAANQAQVVLNGNLILDVDTSKITTTWTADSYSLTNSIAIAQGNYQVALFRKNASGTTGRIISLGTSSGTIPHIGHWNTSDVLSSAYSVTTINHVTSSTLDLYLQSIYRDTSNNVNAYNNGVALTGGTDSTTGQLLTRFGFLNTVGSYGQKQELIFWNSDQSANRTGIETNVNTYWNAY